MTPVAGDVGEGCGGWAHPEAWMIPEACDAGGGCGGWSNPEASHESGGWANPEATETCWAAGGWANPEASVCVGGDPESALLRGVPSTGVAEAGIVLARIGGGGTGGICDTLGLYCQYGGSFSSGTLPLQSNHPCPSSPHLPQRCGPYTHLCRWLEHDALPLTSLFS